MKRLNNFLQPKISAQICGDCRLSNSKSQSRCSATLNWRVREHSRAFLFLVQKLFVLVSVWDQVGKLELFQSNRFEFQTLSLIGISSFDHSLRAAVGFKPMVCPFSGGSPSKGCWAENSFDSSRREILPLVSVTNFEGLPALRYSLGQCLIFMKFRTDYIV